MAAVEHDPTRYELRSDGMEVDYATTDVRGQAQLSYRGPLGAHTYPGGEIDARDTELGREVTVTLHAGEDRDTVNLTLLIPPVHLDEAHSAPLETVAVVTTLMTSFSGPPHGQDYRYEVVPLTGHALFVEP